MKTIILASNNNHKIAEFKEILPEYDILSLKDVGFFDDIVEDGNSFLENSLIKAKAIRKFISGTKYEKALIIADDSGLCVNALGGAPGIYSARYAGDHNFASNRQKLLSELEGKKDRSAYFVCLLVVMQPDGTYDYVEGKTFGEISKEEHGKTDFGYDCLFYSTDLKKTFGEATEEEKNSVSHRGRAIQLLKSRELLK